jgi:hypothetical protein|tara:strand:- start:1029 stop:1361 length:333 start_codon:yes stop_codon:yes gene_type:complete
MTSQLFKRKLPIELFTELLSNICNVTQNKYVLNNASFKKGMLDEYNYISTFLETIKEYYYASKQRYVTNKLTYKSFTTVIRQICKSKEIPYSTEINYVKSSYEIIYYIRV